MKLAKFNFNVSIDVPIQSEKDWKYIQGYLITKLHKAIKSTKFKSGKARNSRVSISYKEIIESIAGVELKI